MSFRDLFNSEAKKPPSRAEVAAFIAAATEGDEKAIKKFCKRYPAHVDAPSEDGKTALYVAARNNKVAAAGVLLDAKADPNKPLGEGESLFLAYIAHHTSDRDRNSVYQSPFNKGYQLDYRLLDKMIKAGANVNFQQQAYTDKSLYYEGGSYEVRADLTTPLMKAAFSLDAQLCDYLLKNGANPLLRDASGKTARDHAENIVQNYLPASGIPVSEHMLGLISKLEQAEKEWVKRTPSVGLKM